MKKKTPRECITSGQYARKITDSTCHCCYKDVSTSLFIHYNKSLLVPTIVDSILPNCIVLSKHGKICKWKACITFRVNARIIQFLSDQNYAYFVRSFMYLYYKTLPHFFCNFKARQDITKTNKRTNNSYVWTFL